MTDVDAPPCAGCGAALPPPAPGAAAACLSCGHPVEPPAPVGTPDRATLPKMPSSAILLTAVAIPVVLVAVVALAGAANGDAVQAVFGAVMLGALGRWLFVMVRKQREAQEAASQAESAVATQGPVAEHPSSTDDHSLKAIGKIAIFWLFISARFVYAILQGKVTLAQGIAFGGLIVLILGGCLGWYVQISRRRS